METGRLEAFSDGVIAIIITIMVLELKVPHASTLESLLPLWPVFTSYVLSFIYVGIYWNNHHHLFQAAKKITGGALWANLHLLFWLSLIPFTTSWTGENHFTSAPTALYGFNLMMAGVAYYILVRSLISAEHESTLLKQAIGDDFKGKVSVLVYGISMVIAFWQPIVAFACYTAVAGWWLIPDRRIEEKIAPTES